MRHSFKLFCFLALPSFLPAQSGSVIYTAPGVADKFLSTHAGAALVKVDQRGATYHHNKAYTFVTSPGSTYQDSSGNWQVTKLQIQALANNTGWQVTGTPVPLVLSDLDATHHNKHVALGTPGALDLQLGDISYAGNDLFTFLSDNQTWTLQVRPTGTLIKTTITSRLGSKNYSFSYSTTGPALTVDAKGNLIAGSLRTTRAAMLTADKKIIPCSAWSVNPNKISFTCDDHDLTAASFPYVIDPYTTGFGFTDSDSNLCAGWDGCNTDYNADFSVNVPDNITITGIDIGADTSTSGDCDSGSETRTPSGNTNNPGQHLDWFYLHGQTVTWHYSIGVPDGGSSCSASVSNTHMNITYTQPPSVSSSNTPWNGSIGNWTLVGVQARDYSQTFQYPVTANLNTTNTPAGGCNVSMYMYSSVLMLADAGGYLVSNMGGQINNSVCAVRNYQGNPQSCGPGISSDCGANFSFEVLFYTGGDRHVYVDAHDGDGQSVNGVDIGTIHIPLPPTSVTIASSPSGRTVTIDGANCTTPCTNQWTIGSQHTINVASTTQAGSTGTQYLFANWSDSGGVSHTITTPSSATTITANFTTQYYLTTGITPASSGSISPASTWLNAGAVQSVSASANANYQFGSFSGGLSGGTTPQNLTMNAPVTVTANFNVTHTITSSPAGRSLTVDGSGCTAPCVVYWSPGSNHTIAAATQAGASGTQYVWASWSDSGAASHSVTAASSPATYTASFTTQYYLTTSAATGGSIAPSSGWYNSGAVQSVSATANGGYFFSGFTGALNGTTTPQNVTMNAPQSVTAAFTGLQTITSLPAGRAVTVDGAACTTPCSYSWTSGTSHTINVATTTQAGATGIQYVFGSWSDSGATSHSITASSSPTTLTANFTTQYYLTTSASPAASGSVAPASGWYNSGASAPVTASANSGYQFANFSNGLTGSANPQSVTMNAPVTVTANFNVLHTIRSSPAGLSLTVDGSSCADPCAVYWSPGSNHPVAASTQSGGAGTQYVWSSWSDSLGASHTVTAASAPATLTANFSTQYYLTTSASPAAGGAITPASGWYNPGATPSVTATPNTGYQFTGFSGDITASTSPQTVTLSAPRSVVANFLAVQTVTSAPTGRTLTVDGASCTTPCTFPSWTANSSHTIAAADQSGATGVQYLFASWSDSGAASHSITAPATPAVYTATFTSQYYLTTSASPSAGGAITPASGWYNSGAAPSVAATPNSGYAFTGFTGDLSGASSPQNVTMSAPRSVTAGFLAVQTVTSVPTGRTLTVDGASCTTPCTFQNWAANSTHHVVASDQTGATGVQYLFANWSDSQPATHDITVAATPAPYTANFTTQYYLTTAASPAAGGAITPASGWYNAGATPSVAATANTGYQFAAFSGGLTGSTTPQNVTMSGPVTVTANFNISYTINISPSTLAFTVDGTACSTPPCTYWWAYNSTHPIAAAATQAGATGVQYVLTNSAWSDSGAASHTVTATAPATITANFTTQYYLTTSASPSAGGTIAPASGWYDANSTVAVTASAASNYQFTAFSGVLTGATTPQNVGPLVAPATVTAAFTAIQTITSSPTGLSFTVDGVSCTTPCTFPWAANSSHTVSAPATIAGGTGTQSVFVAWTQGGAASQSITAPTAPTIYTATYKTQYYLTATAGNGGSIDPPSGWYDANAPVSIAATPNTLYYFTGFSQDLTGVSNPQVLSMTAAKSVTASFATDPTVTVTSSPSGRQLTIDGTACTAPCTFQWTPGSSHTLAAATQSNGTGSQYAFSSWTQGGSASQSLTAPSSPTTYTATFTLQYYLTTSANPTAGGTITPASGWYNSGASVSVSATASTGYQFTGFSLDLSGTGTPQPITMSAAHSVTAVFAALPITTLVSNPANLVFTVDSAACASPCAVQWVPGTSHAIGAGTQLSGSSTQFVFASWSQGGAATQTVTATSSAITYTATFTAQYFVSSSSSPSAAGTVVLSPPGSWYPAGTQVTANVAVNSGWAFSTLTGTASGTVAPQSFTVSGPSTVGANFIPDFTLTATNPPPGNPTGSGVSFTVTVTPQNGFNDTVTFDAPTLPTNATAVFNPTSVTGSGTTTVTIYGPYAGGTYAVTVRGTASSGLSHGAGVNLAIQDFSLTPLTVTAGTSGNEPSTQYQWAINPINGYSGSVSLSSVYIVDPLTPLNPSSSGSIWYQQRCNLTANTGGCGDGLCLTVVPSPCQAMTYTLLAIFWDASHTYSRYANPTLTVSPSSNFSITVSPINPVVPAGSLVTYTFTVAKSGNFSGAVSFTAGVVPSCATVVTAPSIQVQPGQSTTLQLNTSGCANGNTYGLTVSGTNSNSGQTVYVYPTLTIGNSAPPDFSIQPSPSTRSITPGVSSVYTLNVAPSNGFTGNVSLAVSGLPSGATATFPSGSTINSGGAVLLRIDTTSAIATGSPAFTVTGTSGVLAHSTTLTLQVSSPPSQGNFTISNFTALTVPPDGTVVAVPITVNHLNGHTSPVTLYSASRLPQGIVVRFNGLTMMVSAAPGTPQGNYDLLIEGDDGSGGHSRCGGGIGVGPGGITVHDPPYVSSISSPDGQHDPATVIIGTANPITIRGTNFGTSQGYLMICKSDFNPYDPINGPNCFPPDTVYGPGYTIDSSGGPGWTDTAIHVFINMPDKWNARDLKIWIRPMNWIYGATAYDYPGTVKVYDATPVVTSITRQPDGTYQINGHGFGAVNDLIAAQGQVIICPTTNPTCTQTTAEINVGRITLWTNVLITVALSPQLVHSPHYCVRLTSLGQNGNQFNFAPNSASTNFGDCGGDIEVSPVPTVSISGPAGVPLNGSNRFTVTVDQNPDATPITLSIERTTGSGAAQFSAGGTSEPIPVALGTSQVDVQGMTVSSTADNLVLRARDPLNNILASAPFSVVSVTITMNTQGEPADDNASKALFMPEGQALDARVRPKGMDPQELLLCSVAVEFVGSVSPSNYAGTVTLRRKYTASQPPGAIYRNDTPFAVSFFATQHPAGSDDPEDPQWRDTNPQSCSTTTQGPSCSSGKVYDIDAPGIGPSDPDDRYRVRSNFIEYAVLGDVTSTKTVSAEFPWWAVISCVHGDDGPKLSDDVPGDNKAGPGTTKITWDLK